MIGENEKNKIKETASEFFEMMTVAVSKMEVSSSPVKEDSKDSRNGEIKDVVDLEIKLEEPQILIGQGGQTLFEIQRLLRTILNKKLQKIFYLNLDINDYKKKKIEYLQDLAKDLADEAVLTRGEKAFLPMPAYERRAIHSALSERTDVVTESRGEEPNRYIVVMPK